MIDEHPGVVPVTRDVFDVDVVFDPVDPLVADEITPEGVQQLLHLIIGEDRRILGEYDRLRSCRNAVQRGIGFGVRRTSEDAVEPAAEDARLQPQ